MARNFEELHAKMSPESRARVELRVQEALKEIHAEQEKERKLKGQKQSTLLTTRKSK